MHQDPGAVSRHLRALLHREPGREAVVDGVRAIAVAWVFLLHVVFFHRNLFPDEVTAIWLSGTTAWLAQGALGVDLFFVISGFLIGTILLAEQESTGGIHLRRFYARRFLRLMPVYVVVMLLAAPLLLTSPALGGGNLENAWANLL